jgi:hypothetical protein
MLWAKLVVLSPIYMGPSGGTLDFKIKPFKLGSFHSFKKKFE